MQRNIGRGGFILLGFSLLIAACGGDGVLGTGDTGTTVPVATEIIEPPVTSEAPPETTEVPPETTAATAPTTTTFSPGARCQSEGGVFAAAEGPDGVCFPADAITAEEYVIRSVDLDDVDGGLRVWSGPGAPDSKVPQEDKYDETGVIPPYGDGVTATGHATPDGLWFHIQYAGFEGWARSSFMVPSGGAPPLPVCMTGSIGPIPASAQAITSMQANFDGKADQDLEWKRLDRPHAHCVWVPFGDVLRAHGPGPRVGRRSVRRVPIRLRSRWAIRGLDIRHRDHVR